MNKVDEWIAFLPDTAKAPRVQTFRALKIALPFLEKG